jgi:hypothetical protein
MAGPLTVKTRIEVLGMGREKVYSAKAVHGHALEATLAYSRMWGNFTSDLEQRQVPLGAWPSSRR